MRKQGAKRGHELGIARDRRQKRVVRPARKQPVEARESAPRGFQRSVIVVHLGEQAPLSLAFRLARQRLRVEIGDPRPVLEHQRGEFSLPAPGIHIGVALRGRSLPVEPPAQAFLLDRHCEGLVEHRVALDVHLLMGELVKHDARDLGLGILDEGGEDRIGEPAQRRVGADPADVDIVAFLGERVRVPPRALLRIESPVAHAPGDGEAR